MARRLHTHEGQEDSSINTSYLTGTPQDFLFETPYNYSLPPDDNGCYEELPTDLSKVADPVDLSINSEELLQLDPFRYGYPTITDTYELSFKCSFVSSTILKISYSISHVPSSLP